MSSLLQAEHGKPNEHPMNSTATITRQAYLRNSPVHTALFASAALLALPLGLWAAGTESLNAARMEAGRSSQAIPWSDLGAKTTAQYYGDDLALCAGEVGAVRLRCTFQWLEGEATARACG